MEETDVTNQTPFHSQENVSTAANKTTGRVRLTSKSFSEREIDKMQLSTPLINSKSLQDVDNARSKSLGELKMSSVRMITLEEVAPQRSTIVVDNEQPNTWRQKLHIFSSKRQGSDKDLPRSVRRYYKRQNELIKAYEDMHGDVLGNEDGGTALERKRRQASILAKVSFLCNLVLLVGKTVAAVLSGSLSVVTSVIDSAVDLVSGLLMWCSGRAVKRKDPYKYPQGRTKLEPIAIVVLSVIMALASFQVVLQALTKIAAFAIYDLKPLDDTNRSEVLCISIENMSSYVREPSPSRPEFEIDSIIICAITIVTKLVLFIVCHRITVPSAQALAQDHRNDVISNTAAVAFGLIGSKLWKYADAIGAILIGIYIIVSWFLMGWQQIKMLTGHTARPEFLKRITWIALNHHPDITYIETVRAFHFGNNFLVEIDIVLPGDMNLHRAHDIGETLQSKLERLEEVERAFVHLDYETFHDPTTEHKVV